MAELLVDASVSTGGARLLAEFLVDASVSTAGDGKNKRAPLLKLRRCKGGNLSPGPGHQAASLAVNGVQIAALDGARARPVATEGEGLLHCLRLLSVNYL